MTLLQRTPEDSPPCTSSEARTNAHTNCDVLIVGGGINGCGIARDLSGRDLSVVLCERDDLAQHTSSASTKLIHGGIRYLEYYEFGLVRKALGEREGFFRSAPHITRPMRFVMPHDPSMRPAWMLRAGLFLYDHLAKREWLPGSGAINLRSHITGQPLKLGYRRAFVYSDGWVDDARLVVLNALDAHRLGAEILTRHSCVDARREGGAWHVTLATPSGARRVVRARALVNAAGPWASQFLSEHAQAKGGRALRLVKGSHIIVPKLFEHDFTYIFQSVDKRVIFAIPYEGDFTLIGTTDIEHGGTLSAVRIQPEEVSYLCEQASRYFIRPVRPDDVVWSYSGVRPLLADDADSAAAVTRDYQLELDNSQGAPLLNVWGGKITTFRKLAEEAAQLLAAPLATNGRAWTQHAYLPGGDLSAHVGVPRRPDEDFDRFLSAAQRRWPWLGEALTRRLARAYGARIADLVGNANSLGELGEEVGPGLYEQELHFLRNTEWACNADDVLWRRSKLGLHYSPEERGRVQLWFDEHRYSAPGGRRLAAVESPAHFSAPQQSLA